MKLRLKSPSPALIISVIALFVAMGGVGYAAATIGSSQIKNNSVRGKDIRNSTITGKDVKNSGLSGADIKTGGISGGDVKNDSLGGADISESKLGKVPAASGADSVAGRKPFLLRLSTGQTAEIARNGPVSFVAECQTDGGDDVVRVLAVTTGAGSVLESGVDSLDGSDLDQYLNPDTPADSREFAETSDTAGETNVENEIDGGFVLSPQGQAVAIDGEELILGVNYGGAKCIVGGIANSIG